MYRYLHVCHFLSVIVYIYTFSVLNKYTNSIWNAYLFKYYLVMYLSNICICILLYACTSFSQNFKSGQEMTIQKSLNHKILWWMLSGNILVLFFFWPVNGPGSVLVKPPDNLSRLCVYVCLCASTRSKPYPSSMRHAPSSMNEINIFYHSTVVICHIL